ncbi:ATP-dependent zinc protease [Marinobacterium sp. AK62]|uniref:ATP-dependent zinc protease n=1 Tax=Marinobacterium alkalitolerans TaxID=1542925 RepID=A0ABS3Z713_9GAMM|nr:ATP-dependent zinc protease [Marinobacterium alkalitolerans]MBP0047494.1 ATP-dependent zinc protease [Marinobacterium alkalitolerans]
MTETLGWREWVSLPDLGIDKIKAKVDTGARTSALHAFDVQLEETDAGKIVHFKIHPYQRDTDTVVECQAPLLDEREVRDSGGHSEMRYVIEARIVIGSDTHTAEVTLTNRDSMGFRMLIGRTTMKGRYLVDPGKSYLLRKKKRKPATAEQS